MNIETDCFYSDMKENIEKFDTSDYPEDNPYNMPRVNKKIPGLFKDELAGEIIQNFIGLRSKLYAVRTVDSLNKIRKAKGVKSCVLKKQITYNDYFDCIMNNCTIVKKQNMFRSKLHNVFTVEQSKIALSPFDDKRVLINDGSFNTLPYGHKDLNQ